MLSSPQRSLNGSNTLVPMFRFTIRDVLWLMVVVALGTVWWLERRQLITRVEKAEQAYDSTLLLLERFEDGPVQRPGVEDLAWPMTL